MPYLYKSQHPPEPWQKYKRRALHPTLTPLYYLNWLGEWTAYALGQWSIFEILEYLGSFSILIAVVFYFADSGNRLKQKHYQAWQVINTAQGKGGSGGRIEALQELNADGVPLIGVDVSDAYLQGVKLPGADLRRGQLSGTDMRGAILSGADMETCGLRYANLRGADLSRANLLEVNLSDADLSGSELGGAELRDARLDRCDLRGADLAGIRDWQAIRSIRLANIQGVRNAPDGFLAWARHEGAVEISDDAAWEKAESPAPQPPVPAR